MSSPAKKNFRVVENDTWEFTVYLKDENQVAIDLTGTTVRLDVRTSHTASTVALALTEGDGLTVTDAEGKIVVSKTAAVSDGDYVYDLQVVWATPRTKTYLYGQLKVLPEVTQ